MMRKQFHKYGYFLISFKEEVKIIKDMRESSQKFFSSSCQVKNECLMKDTEASGYYNYPKMKEFFQVKPSPQTNLIFINFKSNFFHHLKKKKDHLP